MIPRSLLLSIALPTAVAATVMAVAWRARRREDDASEPLWAGALAFAAAHACAHVALVGWPPFPPVEATQWLLLLVLAAGAVCGIASRLDVRRAQWWTRAVFAFLVPWILLRPLIQHSWSAPRAVAWVVVLGWGMLVYAWALDVAARRHPGPALPLALAITAGGTAVVLVVSGSAFLAQLAGGTAAALCATLCVAVWRPRLSLAEGATPVLALLLTGLWINGAFYAEAHPAALAPVALSGLGGLVTLRSVAPSPTRRVLLAALIATVLAAAGVFIAWATAGRSSISYYG